MPFPRNEKLNVKLQLVGHTAENTVRQFETDAIVKFSADASTLTVQPIDQGQFEEIINDPKIEKLEIKLQRGDETRTYLPIGKGKYNGAMWLFDGILG
jgi:hypothetical protein